MTQHPSVNLVWGRSDSCLVSHAPHKFNFSRQQTANLTPCSQVAWIQRVKQSHFPARRRQSISPPSALLFQARLQNPFKILIWRCSELRQLKGYLKRLILCHSPSLDFIILESKFPETLLGCSTTSCQDTRFDNTKT